MTRASLSRAVSARELAVPCPACGRAPGNACRTKSARIREPHPARTREYQRRRDAAKGREIARAYQEELFRGRQQELLP